MSPVPAPIRAKIEVLRSVRNDVCDRVRDPDSDSENRIAYSDFPSIDTGDVSIVCPRLAQPDGRCEDVNNRIRFKYHVQVVAACTGVSAPRE